MTDFPIRKIALVSEEIFHDGGPPATVPRRRAAALALVHNPFAGRFEPNLQPAMEDLKPLGALLTEKLIAALGGDVSLIDGYGKGAIVGSAGEIEHGALWHVPGGYAMRERLPATKAIVPSAMKVGGFGSSLDVPLGHTNAAYVRSHFDAMTVNIPDGPRPDEILYCLVMSSGPRIHSRMGGLEASQAKGEDGLR
ncbi:amino acid synthesis family protein [Mesorhizobium sp. J428]|uniref:amino acid synthesis family protein n=1 Tax=Mesorhizobium sp. J428 TaxID=2898440 RepID=UPI002151E8A7|nr:amino acid synthesis family protein [Mesorhizobium sp. J428]MCR5858236.1 amino acid synthesis family protein [Mesorhizobium sp. J428]